MCQASSFDSVTCSGLFGHLVSAAFSRSRFCRARSETPLTSVSGNTGPGARLLRVPLHLAASSFCLSASSYLLSLRRGPRLVCVFLRLSSGGLRTRRGVPAVRKGSHLPSAHFSPLFSTASSPCFYEAEAHPTARPPAPLKVPRPSCWFSPVMLRHAPHPPGPSDVISGGVQRMVKQRTD